MDKGTVSSQQQTDCETLLALIPAYSVGATDRAETDFVKARLASCPEAVAELAQYMALSEAMLYSAPPVQAPAALGDKLMAAVAASEPATSPATPPALRQTRQVVRLAWKPMQFMAAALVLVLIVSNFYLGAQLTALHSQQQRIDERLVEQNQALALMASGMANRVELASSESEQNQPYAAILWDPSENLACLYVQRFPALPSDKAYQLWLTHDGKRESGGVFQVSDDGMGTLVFHPSGPINSFDIIGITTEVATGSAGPTTPPIVRRTFRQ